MQENMSYEQAVKRLEEVVKILEKGDLELSKSMELFDEATMLTRYCQNMLDKAEMSVTEHLNKDGESNGK